jgi:orotidine-5'-phosphate decarboxylase
MTRTELATLIRKKQSFLCVGLDTDPLKLPKHLPQNAQGVYEFNKGIIEATLPFAVAYKFNIAFYESMGIEGWKVLERSLKLVPKDEALIIADAKRGDIGNTAAQYAKAFFESLACDAITINPYMGKDSITPFLEYENKWSIVLGLTSNRGAEDIELLKTEDGEYVFEAAMRKIATYGTEENLMFVVGATKAEYFEKVRKVAPRNFFLVPGVGAQGGALEDLAPMLTDDCGLLVNSSRGIIYAANDETFANAAINASERIQQKMALMLK